MALLKTDQLRFNSRTLLRAGNLDPIIARNSRGINPMHADRPRTFGSMATRVKALPDTAPARRPTEVGSFSHFELLEEVAIGGMSVVYKARDLDGQTVALKVMRPEFMGDTARFEREATVVGSLDHPNIVRVLKRGEHEGRKYLVMPFAPGGTLADRLNEFPSDPRRAVELVVTIARAIHYAHARGVVHRDLKPANILLSNHDEPMIADFGLAKLTDAAIDLTRSDVMLGTPAYMAPEQAAGRSASAGEPADVWGLGAILYELVTGCRPFTGHGAGEVLAKIQLTPPLAPRSIRPQLDSALEAVIFKCLEKRPQDRYATAAALADELSRWLRGDAVQAPRVRSRRGVGVGRAACASVLAIVATGGLLAFAFQSQDLPHQSTTGPGVVEAPTTRLATINDSLARGRRTVLVGEEGWPSWHRWRMGMTPHATEKPLSIQTYAPCLLEVLPRVGQDRYRYQAEVTADGIDLNDVGLVLGCHQRATADGVEHWYLALTYAQTPRHRTTLALYRCREKTVAVSGIYHMATLLEERLPEGDPGQWRTLRVETSADQVAVYFDGQLIGRVNAVQMEKIAQRLQNSSPKLPGPPWTWSPHAAVGLYVKGGAGAFRHVAIEPLD